MAIGECWGNLRGPLRETFSFSDIKEIAGAAGLAVHRLGHLQQRQGLGGASKSQLIDSLDLLFAEKPPEDQNRIAAATIREMFRRARSDRVQGMEDQISASLAGIGWGVRSGEIYRVALPTGQSLGMNDPPIRRVDPRTAFATAMGVNEIPQPLREAAERESGRGAVDRVVTVGGQQYEIGGVAFGTQPAWRLIKENGVPLTGPQFDALPVADKQELAAQVQAHLNSLNGSAGGAPLDSSLLGGAPLNTLVVNADSGPSTSAAPVIPPVTTVNPPIAEQVLPLSARAGGGGLTGRAKLSVSAAPPEVPEPGPAMIEPVWMDGRLALLKGLPANDMADDGVVNLIAAVRRGFERFIGALSKPGTNLHPGLRSYIEGMPDLIVGVPDQVQVFEMGHAVEHLEAQQGVIEDELGAPLANHYRMLVAQFRRCVERFPCWRELASSAKADPLPADQAEQAVPAARAMATALTTEEAGKVIDPSVSEALRGLADAAEKATTPAERGLLDFDLVSSMRRIMTALYQPVLYCWNEVGNSAWSELKKLPGQVGSGAVKWTAGTLVAIAALHVGTAPLAASVATLAAHNPTQTRLPPVEEFLKFLATLPKG